MICALGCLAAPVDASKSFEGRFFRGTGDVEYLQLLDISRRMFSVDPQYQNLSMLYTPWWNGLVEGPTWDAWWIQNSYGTTYCALPFYEEPFLTFLQNSHDLWFDQMGDGKRAGAHGWVAPDGQLCDCARPGLVHYKQGDGRIDIHDWGVEFTAAGILMQAELLLIGRDPKAIEHYLPMLERCAAFLETRRDPDNDLYLAGPAGNLLAPSYAGWKRPDGTYDKAYLSGLSVTYIAALDRLAEVEKLAGNPEKARTYLGRARRLRASLSAYATDDGYLIRSIDPDGVKHGVFGAAKHGYIETSPNHDAVCFRVVDDDQALRIYNKIADIPGLRPHDLVIPNYPSYDDLYTEPKGLWEFGRWVNGGHWSTCEARMMMGYYRLGWHEDARRSMKQMLKFADSFRMDNPLVDFGSDVYQPKEPVNLCYDSFGPPAAMVRGLFEYLYAADGVTLVPHIPEKITSLDQRFPVRLGSKRLYLSTTGTGPVTSVVVNGAHWTDFDDETIRFPFGRTPDVAHVAIALGGCEPRSLRGQAEQISTRPNAPPEESLPAGFVDRFRRLISFVSELEACGLGDGCLAAHARLALEAICVIPQRKRLLEKGTIATLPEPSGAAGEASYVETANKLYEGLEAECRKENSADAGHEAARRIWNYLD